MDEWLKVEITAIEQRKYRFYKVLASLDRTSGHSILDAHLFTPGELLELAAWVEQNRAQLEQEARVDDERNARAWAADRADRTQIKREWHDYRLHGDESPPTPPSQLG